MDKEKLLIDAFGEKKFRESLQQIRLKIEDELRLFLSYLKEISTEEHRFFENAESRVKSELSFMEKIKRHNYTGEWQVKNTISENQKLICTRLNDLIGFRINCFFIKDEEYIYNELKLYYEKKKFSNKFSISMFENDPQKNGHMLYKVLGQYDEKYNFEIQIKSLFNNVWGEVEHKTIYKGQHFDSDTTFKKNISEEVFNILCASDKQLLEIFNNSKNETQLVQMLFYCQTSTDISKKFNTKILANHYLNFFSIFKTIDFHNDVKTYVATSLLNQPFQKRKIETIPRSEVEHLKTKILKEFIEYDIEFLYELSSFLYAFDNKEQFLDHFVSYLLKSRSIQEEADIADYIDAFEEEILPSNPNQDIIELLANNLRRRK